MNFIEILLLYYQYDQQVRGRVLWVYGCMGLFARYVRVSQCKSAALLDTLDFAASSTLAKM